MASRLGWAPRTRGGRAETLAREALGPRARGGQQGERVLRVRGHLSALSPRGGRTEATCSPRPGVLRTILRAFSVLGGSPGSRNRWRLEHFCRRFGIGETEAKKG